MICAEHGLQLRFYGGLTLFSSIRLKGGALFAMKTKAGRWGKIRPSAHSHQQTLGGVDGLIHSFSLPISASYCRMFTWVFRFSRRIKPSAHSSLISLLTVTRALPTMVLISYWV